MGILDKLKFWKRDEGLDAGDPFADDNLGPPGDPMGLNSAPGQNSFDRNTGQGYNQGFNPPTQGYAMQTPSTGVPVQSQDQVLLNKNIEIISSKIDALRATLESIGHRLANLERLAQQEPENRNDYRHWKF